MTRLVRAVLAVAVVLLGTVVLAPTADAHTPKVLSTCEQLTVDLQSYDTRGDNAVTVTIDGKVVDQVADFGSRYSKSFAYDFGSKESLSWMVRIAAWDDTVVGDTEGFSRTLTGTERPCTPPPPQPQCVPTNDAKALLSYTFDGDRKGTVTLSGDSPLCKPFYVRAATWTYDNPAASEWPQTLQDYNDVTVEQPGTYSYEAPAAGCAQHDIYAAWDKDKLALPGNLKGPNNPYEPTFLHQQTSNGPNPTWSMDDRSKCTSPTEPAEVTAKIGCAEGGLVVTIPSTPHVRYLVDGVETPAGERIVPVAEDAAYDVTVTAEADQGYELTSKGPWRFQGTRNCEDEAVTPTKPTADIGCDEDGLVVTVPDTPGVEYLVDGDVVTGSTTIPVAEDAAYDVTVTARAKAGYVLEGTGSWTFTGTRDCEQQAVEPVAPTVDATCADGGLLLSVEPTEGISWQVDGEPVDGSEVLVEVGEGEHYGFVVTATALDGYRIVGDDTWAIDGVRDCEATPAEPGAPSVSNQCVDGGVMVTVPEVEGVEYRVDGEVVDGDVVVPVAEDADYRIEVTATAEDGYVVQGSGQWVLEGTRNCEQPATPTTTPKQPEVAVLGVKIPAAAPDTLPRTGGEALLTGGVATGLLAVGGLLLMVTRRRKA